MLNIFLKTQLQMAQWHRNCNWRKLFAANIFRLLFVKLKMPENLLS